ncbi:phenoloxidase-activating factor 2-like [Photinus pyralis]|nr:phenoloxidase-activating factor 2-like [Photinus pyralis]XP_031358697.1 phenoloxidase-activating factor 2-like [Photinus pyralis]
MHGMNLSIVSCCLLLLGWKQCAGATNGDDVSHNSTSNGNDQGFGDCECVPYFKCNGPTRNTGCDDFLSVCCESKTQFQDEIIPKKHDRGCGRRNPNGLGFSSNGDADHAQFGEFPWMMALLGRETTEGNLNESWSYQCGASLIHRQVVLTAAHCISGKYMMYKIRAGEWDTRTENEFYPRQERTVKTAILHPEYSSRSLTHDFALLILESPVKIQNNIDVVCLPAKEEIIDNITCYATGWGRDNFGKEGDYDVLLKKLEAPILDGTTCESCLRHSRLGSRFKLHESFLCTGGQPDIDICKADGGSPLVCPIKGKLNKYYQAGIISWALNCVGVPGVYANVIKALDWIDKTMTDNGFETSSYKY